MNDKWIDITDAMTWDEGIPAPQWDLLTNWVDAQVEDTRQFDAWTDIARQWLEHVGTALGTDFCVYESTNTLILSNLRASASEAILSFAEHCRGSLILTLHDVAVSQAPGKSVIVVLPNAETYYTYYSRYAPEGEQGGSVGVQIREGYPHIAINAAVPQTVEATIAHEMMHASLLHLTLPQWVEEGLAQMFEHTMTSRGLLLVTGELANEHKGYWKKRGLDAFWRGEGFYKAGRMQKLSYQLAEVLLRLLYEEHRPRWFGLVKAPQRRFFQFLRFADVADCGAESARTHLRISLSDIAGKFLGPGEWEPSL